MRSLFGSRVVAPRLARVVLATGLCLGGAGGSVAALASSAATPAGAATPLSIPAITGHAAAPETPAPPSGYSPHATPAPAPGISSTPEVAPANSIADTYVVDTENDTPLATSGSTTCADANGNCSLRAAIEAAENDYTANGNIDQIDVPDGYDILLDSANGPLTVTSSMFIGSTTTGATGSGDPVVDGQGATEVLAVTGGALELTDLVLQNGNGAGSPDSSDGGVVYDDADLTLSGVTVQGGNAAAGDGGGIYADGAGSLWTDANTVITDDSAEYGGGLYVDGNASITGSIFSGNSATDEGGAVYNDGGLTVQAADYSGNSARDGGAYYNAESMVDTGSTFTDNTAGSASDEYVYGAVLDNEYTAVLNDATVSGSTATADGNDDGQIVGGVIYNGGQLTLNDDAVSDTTNRCDGCNGDQSDEPDSGGIFGGVIANEYDLSTDGLTISGTTNGTTGTDTYIQGGAVYNGVYEEFAPTIDLTASNLDISGTTNASDNDDLFGGAISGGLLSCFEDGDDCDGAPVSVAGTMTLTHTTVSGTADTVTGADVLEGGALDLENGANVDDLAVSNTTVSAGTASVLGGAVDFGTLLEEELPGVSAHQDFPPFAGTDDIDGLSIDGTTVTAQDTGDDSGIAGGGLFTQSFATNVTGLSITNTSLNDTGGGGGDVAGGGWGNFFSTTATDVQVLGTTVTADEGVYGGAFAGETLDDESSSLTDSTFGATTVTATGGGVEGAVAAIEGAPMATVNVTMDDSTTTVPTGSDDAAALYFDDSVQLTNDTIANDTLQTADGSAFAAGNEGGIVVDDAPASFKNTIVATTPASGNCQSVDGGTITSAGGNLDSGSSCGFTQPSDQQNVNPKVAAVADNEGPVETAALEPGSPAIGAGVPNGCPATDARGVTRPAGDCDSGAFQTSDQGYWEVASDGGVFAFGAAQFYGSTGDIQLNQPVVGMAATGDQGGYWLVAADGGIFSFGDARFHGSMGDKRLDAPVTSMASTPHGGGYWEVAKDGGIFAFGDAQFYGSMGGQHLNAPVVGMAPTPDGGGYWLVASDGGVFAFGDAGYYGSMGGKTLDAPIVAIAATPDGGGYWEVAADGGIFAFGDAQYYGSMGGKSLDAPIVAMANTPDGQGYWMFAADGGVFSFGDAVFQGSMGGKPLNQPMVGGTGFARL